MKHTIDIEVRYCETDQMGIVHHSRYYPWFEMGRVAFVKSLGFSYDGMEKNGVLLPLTETYCKYIKGAMFGDVLTIETFLSDLSYAKCTFSYNVMRHGEVIATGYTKHGFVNADFKPISLVKHDKTLWNVLLNAIEK